MKERVHLQGRDTEGVITLKEFEAAWTGVSG